jgi:hypothetical protein
VYGDTAALVGIGVFHTFSTRNAGLQLADLRRFNQARVFDRCLTSILTSMHSPREQRRRPAARGPAALQPGEGV